MNVLNGIRLLCAAMIVLVPFAVCPAQEKAGDLKIEPYVFENSKKEKVDAEFGRLLVPENRNDPRSRRIELCVC